MIKTGLFGQQTPEGVDVGRFFMDINKHLNKKMYLPTNNGMSDAKNKALLEFSEPAPSFQKALYRSMTENMEGHKEAKTGYTWTGEMQNYLLESLKFLAPYDRAYWSGLSNSQLGGHVKKVINRFITVNGNKTAKDPEVIKSEKDEAIAQIAKIDAPHYFIDVSGNKTAQNGQVPEWQEDTTNPDNDQCLYYIDSPFVQEKLKNGAYGHYITTIPEGTGWEYQQKLIGDSHWGQQNFGGTPLKAWGIGHGNYYKNINFLGAASDWNNIYNRPLDIKTKDAWSPEKHLTPPGGKQALFDNILNPQASGKIGATDAKIGKFEIMTERTPYNVAINGASDNGWPAWDNPIEDDDADRTFGPTNIKLKPDDKSSDGTPVTFDKDCNIDFLLDGTLNGNKGTWTGEADFNLYKQVKERYNWTTTDASGVEHDHTKVLIGYQPTGSTTTEVRYYGNGFILSVKSDGNYEVFKASEQPSRPDDVAAADTPGDAQGTQTFSAPYGASRILNDDTAHFNTGFMSTDKTLPQVTGPVWQMVQKVLNLYKPYNKNDRDDTGNGGQYTDNWYKNAATQYAYTGGWRDIAVNNIYKDIDTNIQTNYSNIFPQVTFSADQTEAKKQATALHKLCLMIGLNESRRRYTLAMNVLMGSHDIDDDTGNKTYWWNNNSTPAPGDAPGWDWTNTFPQYVASWANGSPWNSTLSGIVWHHYQIAYNASSPDPIFAAIKNNSQNHGCFNNNGILLANTTLTLPHKGTSTSPNPNPSPNPVTTGIVVGDKDVDWYNTMLFQIFTTTIHPIYNNMYSIFNDDVEDEWGLDGAWGAYGFNMRKWLLDIDLDTTQDNFTTTELDMTLLNGLNFDTNSTDSLTGLKTAYCEFKDGSDQAFPSGSLKAGWTPVPTTSLEYYNFDNSFSNVDDSFPNGYWFKTSEQFFQGYQDKVIKILANTNNPTEEQKKLYTKGPKSLAKYYMEHQNSTTNWAVHNIATSIYAEEEIVKESIKDFVINSAIQSVTDKEWKAWEDNVKKKTETNLNNESDAKKNEGKLAGENKQLELAAAQHAMERRKQLLSLAAKKKAQNKK
ncbi:MAG: hypothetical protein A2X11_04650 [Bacteroidetes bacterium GWE2_42_24]|nr:MAG: hypothetical protein A2X11_04650 [Bacteroidetes bacterium GWE2_42_24]